MVKIEIFGVMMRGVILFFLTAAVLLSDQPDALELLKTEARADAFGSFKQERRLKSSFKSHTQVSSKRLAKQQNRKMQLKGHFGDKLGEQRQYGSGGGYQKGKNGMHGGSW